KTLSSKESGCFDLETSPTISGRCPLRLMLNVLSLSNCLLEAEPQMVLDQQLADDVLLSNKALKGSYLLFATMGLACGGERAQLDREAGNPNENPLDRRAPASNSLCRLALHGRFATKYLARSIAMANTCGSDRNIRVPGVPLSGRDTRAEPYLFSFQRLVCHQHTVRVRQPVNRPIDSLEELKQVFLYAIRSTTAATIFLCYRQMPRIRTSSPAPVPTRQLVVWSLFMAAASRQEIRSNILPNDTVNSGLLSGSLVAGFRIFPRLAGHAMLVSCACLCSSATALLWWVFADQKSQLDAKEAVNFPLLDLETQNEDAFLVLSIVSTVLLLVLLFCLCVVCSRARYVGPLFVQAAKCVGAAAVRPAIVTCLLLGSLFALWLWTLAYISTSALPRSEPRMIPSITMNNSLIREPIEPCLAMDRPSWVSWLWIYHVAGLLWIGEFALACQQYVLAGSPAALVLSGRTAQRQMAGGRGWPIWCGVGWPLAALVIAVTRLPRWALSWFHKRLRNQKACGGSDACCCVRCRRLNKSALAAAALTGEPFWSAAGAASDLLGNKHASLRLAALNSAGDFLKWSDKSIRFFPLPIVLVATFAFLVAHCFLSVFEFVIDAIFICFSYDLGTNDGSPGREQFMTDDLKNLVFDTCDAMTSNLPPGSIGNSSSRRQAAAATMRLTSSGVQQENGAKTAAMMKQPLTSDSASWRISTDGGRAGHCSAAAGPADSSLPMRRMQAPTASQEADDDLRSLRTPASTPMRSTGGPADQGSGTMPSLRLFDLLA
uniref:Choline transporter-like protein n=1 Tax=Macrostomum lignano TaxID=282301 RepID=A0A1I8FKB4_9PLAT